MAKISHKSKKIIMAALICVFTVVFVGSAIMLINTMLNYREASALYDKVHSDFMEALSKTTGDGSDTGAKEVWVRGETTAEPVVTDPPVTATPGDVTSANIPDTDKSTADTEMPPETTAPEPVYSERFINACDQIKKLQEVNKQVIGYIYIEFSASDVISYPIVQADDNYYYVTHAYDESELKSGAIFLDYRCYTKLMRNNISLMFGHNMNNGAMFHKLTLFKQQKYFDSVNIVVYTLEGIYTYEVFSIYNTTTDSDYSYLYFDTDAERLEFYEKLRTKSMIATDMPLYGNDKMLTLATCLNTTLSARLAVHAVLVKIEQ